MRSAHYLNRYDRRRFLRFETSFWRFPMMTSNVMRLFKREKREGRRQRKVGNGPTSCELERLTELTRRVTSVS
jgi:hypothetical protein